MSSLPHRGREGGPWTIVDTAHALHKLMTGVLGYGKYVGQAGDWVRFCAPFLKTTQFTNFSQGSHTLRILSSLYAPNALPLTLFSMLHCPLAISSPSETDIAQMTQSEQRAWARRLDFYEHGQGYFHLQRTKVCVYQRWLDSVGYGSDVPSSASFNRIRSRVVPTRPTIIHRREAVYLV